jgi:hypothetical protein
MSMTPRATSATTISSAAKMASKVVTPKRVWTPAGKPDAVSESNHPPIQSLFWCDQK